MGFVWQSDDVGAGAVDARSFAEVVYEQDDILVVNLALGLERDPALADALMDVIATIAERDQAEWAIGGIAGRFGLSLVPAGSGRQRELTIAPLGDPPS